MDRFNIHLHNVKGAKTIIKNLKKFDKNLIVRDYKWFIVVESDDLPHYVCCNSISTYTNCVLVYDRSNHDRDMTIPLSMIETIYD